MSEHRVGGLLLAVVLFVLLTVAIVSAEGESCTTDANCFCGDLCQSSTSTCVKLDIRPFCSGLAGDVDQDNEVTCRDAECVLEYQVGLPGADCTNIANGDVGPWGNPDGHTDIGDVNGILRLAAQNGYNCQSGNSDPPGAPSNTPACITNKCNDEVDNDIDGQMDWNGFVQGRRIWPDDSDCCTRSDNTESTPPPPQ